MIKKMLPEKVKNFAWICFDKSDKKFQSSLKVSPCPSAPGETD